MFISFLMSLCCVVFADDTLDVATVSSKWNPAAETVSPVQSMSQAQIQRMGTVGLHEALNQFSGVSVKDYGGVGGLKTVSVRNMGASHTSVIYDGISISDAQNGQVDISRFSLDDVSSISMSIGVEDDIFCSARHLISAGTLRIKTLKPVFDHSPVNVSARVSAGCFGTFIPFLSVAGKLGEPYALKLSARGTISDGNYPFTLHNGSIATREMRVNSDVRSFGAEAVFYADWEDKGRLKVMLNYLDSERGLPGPVILYTVGPEERLWDKSLISSIMYECDFTQTWKIHADFSYSGSYCRHLDTDPAYPEPLESRYLQNEYALSVRGLYKPSERWKITLAEDVFVNELSSDIPECPFPVRLTSMTALTAGYYGPSFKAYASVVGTVVTEKLRLGNPPDDRMRLSPMLGLSWNFIKGFCLRASVKEGFRVPTFNDLYYARVGNIHLRPETALLTNLGLTFSRIYGKTNVDISVDAYYNSVKDKINAIPTMFIWKMTNIGKVDMFGLDARGSAGFGLSERIRLYLTGNYSLQYALDSTSPSSKTYKHQIPYTPRHCGSASVSLEMPWLDITYRMNAVGKRYAKAQNLASNALDAYADHGICIGRDFTFGRNQGCRMRISLEANNLADENYEIIGAYPMPGRSYRLTLNFKY